MYEFLFSGWVLQFTKAIGTSVTAAISSFALSILIGIVLSLWSGSRSIVAAAVVRAYTYIFRSLPDVLLLIILFYSIDGVLQSALAMILGIPDISISPLIPGIFSTAIVLGAYSTELFKAGWSDISRGQHEAARSLGLTSYQSLGLVILPQVYRKMIPYLGSLWVVSMKETALLSIIGIPDVVRIASLGARSTGLPFTFYGIAISIFIVFAVLSAMLFHRLERNARRSVGAA